MWKRACLVRHDDIFRQQELDTLRLRFLHERLGQLDIVVLNLAIAHGGVEICDERLTLDRPITALRECKAPRVQGGSANLSARPSSPVNHHDRPGVGGGRDEGDIRYTEQ